MAGLLDYLFWRGDIPRTLVPFTPADVLLLTRFSCLPLGEILSYEDSISVPELAERMLAQEEREPKLRQQQDPVFLSEMQKSVRFADVVLSRYANRWDAASAKQFAAICADVDDIRYVLFRGTDGTLVGWKEDLNMSFMQVPSQKEAAAYLDAAYDPDKRFVLAGHSKGGNLAVYAAAFGNPVIQEQIEWIYSFDGPGFLQDVMQSDGYRAIRDKTRTFVPQTSVVGMLLDHEEAYTIIESSQRGLMQHEMYSWNTCRDGFVCLDTVNAASGFIDSTLKDWLAELDVQERAEFVDSLFNMLEAANVHTVEEFFDNKYRAVRRVVSALRQMEPEKRRPMGAAMKSLMQCVQNNAKTFLSQREEKEIVSVE